MKKIEAIKITEKRIQAHNLNGWSATITQGKRQAGHCNYMDKRIGISKYLVESQNDYAVIDTILHEVAHAIVGHEHGHDKVWRNKAIELGCTGERLHTYKLADYKYDILCPIHGRIGGKYRKPRGIRLCRKCHSRVKYVKVVK